MERPTGTNCSGTNSAVDFPASCAWEDLAAEYPLAKVILTVRGPGRWWTSTATTIYRTRTMFPDWFTTLVPVTRRWLEMTDRLVWQGIVDGRFDEREHAVLLFEDHIERVRSGCQPHRLLEFDVSD